MTYTLHMPDNTSKVHCSGLYKQALNEGRVALHTVDNKRTQSYNASGHIKEVTSYIKHHENTIQIIMSK